MADVIQKAISANAVRQNGCVCYVTANGTKQVLRRDKEKAISIQDNENKLTNKFDDTTYYST
jgi:hypothetical protein